MLNLPYTYLHRRNDTGAVFYIGKGRGRRAYQGSAARRNSHWIRIADKHGFTVEIVSYWPTDDEAFEHEVFLMDIFRSMGFDLCNSASGGRGGLSNKPTEATRMKRSISLKKTYADPDLRERLRARGAALWSDPKRKAEMTKVHRDSVYRKEMSERMLEIAQSPAYQEAKSEGQKRRWEDPEYRERMRLIRVATMQKPEVRLLFARPVICTETGIRYASTKEAARLTGLAQSSVSYSCNTPSGAAGKSPNKRHFKFCEGVDA